MRDSTNCLAVVVLGLALALLFSPANAQSPALSVEDRYTELHRIERVTRALPERGQADAISRSYERQFTGATSSESLRRASDLDLGFMLKAAEVAAFYTFDSKYLEDMRMVLVELERRGIAADDQRIAVYLALIGARNFDAARALNNAHPALQVEPVPEVTGGPNHTNNATMVYRVSVGRAELRKTWLHVDKESHLIIVAHPLCEFSRRAMMTLQADLELGPILARHATWLAPVDRRLHLDAVRNWNRDNPATQVFIAHKRSDWPMIDAWATPQFYLVQNGRLVGKIKGWPENGNRDALVELLSIGGLLDMVRLSPRKVAAVRSGIFS